MRSRILTVAAVALALVGCEFEPELTPIDWGNGPQAPAFELDAREQQLQAAIEVGDHQGAIDLAIELYEIDTSHITGSPTYAPDLKGEHVPMKMAPL